jgi:hypothetical protein
MHEYDRPTAEPAAGMEIDDQPTTDAPTATEPPHAGPGPSAGATTAPTSAPPVTEPPPATPHANDGPAPTSDSPAFAAAQPQPGFQQRPADPQTPPPGWDHPGPNGYPQYHQPAVPAYGPPVYGPPPVPPAPQPEPTGGRGQRGLIIALAGLIAALLLGAGVAVIMVVSSKDEPPRAGTAAATAPPRTVTTVIRETTVTAKPTSSSRSSRRRSSSSSRSISPSRRSTAATASTSSPSVARTAIKSMLQRHFATIRDGNLSSAYADLGGSLAQTQSSWTADIRNDGLYAFNLSVSPEITSPTTAVANIVSFHTEAQASGCKDWSGSWNVARSGGRWVITKSNLSQTVVSCGE